MLEDISMKEIGELELAKEIAHYLSDPDGNPDNITLSKIEESVEDRQLIYDMKKQRA